MGAARGLWRLSETVEAAGQRPVEAFGGETCGGVSGSLHRSPAASTGLAQSLRKLFHFVSFHFIPLFRSGCPLGIVPALLSIAHKLGKAILTSKIPASKYAWEIQLVMVNSKMDHQKVLLPILEFLEGICVHSCSVEALQCYDYCKSKHVSFLKDGAAQKHLKNLCKNMQRVCVRKKK